MFTPPLGRAMLTPPHKPIHFLPGLTTASAAYAAVHSPERLLSSYSGPTLQAASGPTDFGFGLTGATPGEVFSLRAGGQDVLLSKAYDQSGNAADAEQDTTTMQPAVHDAGLIGGKLAFLFHGILQGDFRGALVKLFNTVVSLDQQDFTAAFVVDPTNTLMNQGYLEFYNGGTGWFTWLQYYADALGLPDVHGAMSFATAIDFYNTGKKTACVPQVLIFRSAGSGVDVFLDGVFQVNCPQNDGTSTGFALGSYQNRGGIASFNPTWRCAASVLIDKGVNDADVAALNTTLMARFDIPSAYDAIVVLRGTSRDVSNTASTDTLNKTFWQRQYYRTDKRIKVYNLAQDGTPLSAEYPDRENYDGEVYDATVPMIYIVDDAINDLGGLGDSSDPTDIYATISDFITYYKTLGSNVKTVIETTMPQNSTGAYGVATATIDANRATLNTAIRGNAAGADVICDQAADPAMGVYTTSVNNTALYQDALHPTSLGYSILAPYAASTINGLL